MEDISVNPDELDRLARQLGDIVSGMNQAGKNIIGYLPLDLGPTADVWTALSSFHSDWSDGVTKIKTNLAALESKLAEAAKAYRAVESKLASQASSAAGGPL